MRKILIALISCASYVIAFAQQEKAEHLIIVTLDGFRWQEMFSGADSLLIRNPAYTKDSAAMMRLFWADNPVKRREKLLPFIWGVPGRLGRMYGNHLIGSRVSNANPHWFSYPGYNEIFTGYPDSSVNSNDKIPNRHENVLAFLNRQAGFGGRVAAFTSWDVFPWILNETRSGFPVNSGFESLSENASEQFKLLEDMQKTTYRPLGDGVRPDLLTYFAAKEYLKKYKPRVLYIGFDETDDFAHAGNYDMYLQAASMTDRLLEDLWNYIQSDPQYRNRTALLITTDHGRGDQVKSQWRDHGSRVKDAHEIWFAVMGPGIPAGGEIRHADMYYQAQLAATIARVLGFSFTAEHPVAPFVHDIFRK
jgi:hypothetical protein